MEKFESGRNIPRLEQFNSHEANSVLYGIEVIEKNFEITGQMLKIKEEMSKRPYLQKDINPDTGEVKKGGKTELEGTKEELKKHIKDNLTRPSKYVKGA